jgi:hypothetical protein
MKEQIIEILIRYNVEEFEADGITNELLNLFSISNRISDEEIKRYRKEGRLSGATKRELFYKLIAQKFDENYEGTDFDILYDC